MKVKIERETNIIGRGYFFVYANGQLVKSFVFDPLQENQKIWGEDVSRKEALEFAKRLEKSDSLNALKETIYETPE